MGQNDKAVESANVGEHMLDEPSPKKRVALVIGNSAYVHLGELANPTNDAQDISKALEALDFSVATGVDLARDPMENVFFEFETAIRDADVALLFYSGHRLQVKGENYLLPVDAKIEMEMHLKRRAFSLSEILEVMGARTQTNLIFLDACRNNPFGSEPSRAIGLEGERALRRGLAKVEKAQGIFIAFAAAANEVALDGMGRNSRFTAALLKHIDTPGLSIADMMMDVSNTVAVETYDRQQPWQQSNLRAKFFFRPLEAASDKTANVELAEQPEKERIETQKAAEHDKDLHIGEPDHAPWESVLRVFKKWAPSATKVAAIVFALGLLAYVVAGPLSFVAFGIVVLLLIGFLIVLVLYLPQTYEISEYLNLAERELNSLLRGWGGGLTADKRKAIA